MKDMEPKEVAADNLFEKISSLIEESRRKVKTAVNLAMVYTYYEIGRYIVEYEQNGQYRAAYGKQVLATLSTHLTTRFGKGWSVDTLENCRAFFRSYSISETPSRKSPGKDGFPKLRNNTDNSETAIRISVQSPEFHLSWSHYLVLIGVRNPDARRFYEIETEKQNWSVRQLSRQVGSSLYERLALSRDKDAVMRLSEEGQTIEKSSDIIKDPLTLEFLGLTPDTAYSESNLEKAIISKMQQFLLELGKGFLFEARQKRFTFDEEHFYVDLVFYNRLLQCYVLIDLKTDKLTHQDLGQMQMYVNYYDRYVKQDFEKPTVGILLCKRKNNALVELTLPKDTNIYATEYALYLPDKKELQQKLESWIEEFHDNEKR